MHEKPLSLANISIGLLADCPEDVEVLARLFYDEWPEYSGSVEANVARFEGCTHRDRIPLVLVAHRDGTLAGTVALLEQSVDSHGHLAPWIGGLYVCPQARHAGLAMRLVAAAEELAFKLGYETVYIGISAAEPRYEREGWNVLGEGRAGAHVVTVLSKTVGAS